MDSQERCKSKRDEMLQLIVRPLVPKLPGAPTGSALFIRHMSRPAPLLTPIMHLGIVSGAHGAFLKSSPAARLQHPQVFSFLSSPSSSSSSSTTVAVGLWIWLEMINLAFSKSHRLICVALMSQNMQKVAATVGGWNRFQPVSASSFSALSAAAASHL